MAYQGYLSKEAYLAYSARAQGTFAHARERVYELYLAYRALKGMNTPLVPGLVAWIAYQSFLSSGTRGDWDQADRSFAIVKALREAKDLPKIHRLYVDESQDNLLMDAQLLRSLVCDPHGHFWAGDTAQTISASSFRFEDLRYVRTSLYVPAHTV